MKVSKAMLFLLFSLSGFAGLIYESIWSHYIKLILGHAAYSQTLVLGIFMGGMAIGAWLVSRLTLRLYNPLKWYAIIELIIGCFGVFFHQEFLLAKSSLFDLVLPSIESTFIISIIKWLIAAMLLLPQAIMLGATFPLMSAAVIRFDKEKSGNTLSMLYFSNSMGAAIGVLVSGFILIDKVGLPGTSFTAGLINIVIAVFIWPLARDLQGFPPVTISSSKEKKGGVINVMLIIALLTGMASFFYEIAWIRMLSLVLGSSTQAFELMLSAFILGLAFGSFFIRNRSDVIKNTLIALAWIQIIMGVLATSTLPLYMYSFDVMSSLRAALAPNDEGYVLFHIGSHIIAMAIMLPATLMAGMTLPLITNSLLKRGCGEASIGRVYAANTVGAIIGIVLAINLLMPVIGMKGLIVFGGAIDIAAGIIIFIYFRKAQVPLWKYSIPMVGAIGAILLFNLTTFDYSVLSSGVYRTGVSNLGEEVKTVFYRDGKTATIAVLEYPSGSKSIRTNGKTDALINPLDMDFSSDEVTMVMAAAVPLMFKNDAEYVANIGMGSGLTTHAVLQNDRIKKVDTIEIESAMVEGAKSFGERVALAFNDERSKIHIDDAKSFFSNHGNQYDIIISEPSNPWVSGVASLFTEEFYQHTTKYLKPGGVFVQWLQLYESNLNNVSSVIRALDKSFIDYRIYNTDNANILIIASKDVALNEPSSWVFDESGLQSELKRVGIESIDDTLIRYLGNKNSLGEFFAEAIAPVNSDYFPYLSQSAPKSFYKSEIANEILSLHSAPFPILRWINDSPPIKHLSEEGGYFSAYEKTLIAENIINFSLDSLKYQSSDIAGLSLSLSRINNSLIDCNDSSLTDQTLKNSLYLVAVSVNPYLPREKLESFWDKLINSCPEKFINDEEAMWLSFHRAVGRKDVEAILPMAKQLLEKTTSLKPYEYYYLLSSILTVNIISDNRTESFAVLRDYYAAGLDKNAPIYLKYLVGLTLPLKTTIPN